MVLAMAERGMLIDRLLITPTGDELPGMTAHWEAIAERVGLPLTVPKGPTLGDVIDSQRALPNFRMRFCTRMVKIVPAIAWVKRQALAGHRVIMYVGLRADEEERKGIIDRGIDTRFPLREFGMGLSEVLAFLRDRCVTVPKRTDCARCYHQRLGEWWELWKAHPEILEDAVRQEAERGATFRSPGRDTWPVGLAMLRAKFERGHVPRGADVQLPMFSDGNEGVCRVCSL